MKPTLLVNAFVGASIGKQCPRRDKNCARFTIEMSRQRKPGYDPCRMTFSIASRIVTSLFEVDIERRLCAEAVTAIKGPRLRGISRGSKVNCFLLPSPVGWTLQRLTMRGIFLLDKPIELHGVDDIFRNGV